MHFAHFSHNKYLSMWTRRMRLVHILKYIKRAPQALASDRDGNQTDSEISRVEIERKICYRLYPYPLPCITAIIPKAAIPLFNMCSSMPGQIDFVRQRRKASASPMMNSTTNEPTSK